MQPSFLIDVLSSLLNASLLHKPAGSHILYRVGPYTFVARKRSMDSVILMESIILHEYDRYLPSLSQGDVVIDIGTHIGDFSIPVAKKHPEIRVISVEPHPENHTLLLENIRRNSVTNIKPNRVAVGRSSGTIKLSEDPANTGGNSVVRNAGNVSITVPCVTLEELFTNNRIKRCRFLKIDCEGAEYDIIDAAPKSLLASIDTIVMEYHNSGPIGEVAEKLRTCGFSVRLTSGITNPVLKPFVHAPFCIATREYVSLQRAE